MEAEEVPEAVSEEVRAADVVADGSEVTAAVWGRVVTACVPPAGTRHPKNRACPATRLNAPNAAP